MAHPVAPLRPGRGTEPRRVPRRTSTSWCRSTATGARAGGRGCSSAAPTASSRRARRRTLRGHLDGFEVLDGIDAIPRELRGLHPDNPVNRPRGRRRAARAPAARARPRPERAAASTSTRWWAAWPPCSRDRRAGARRRPARAPGAAGAARRRHAAQPAPARRRGALPPGRRLRRRRRRRAARRPGLDPAAAGPRRSTGSRCCRRTWCSRRAAPVSVRAPVGRADHDRRRRGRRDVVVTGRAVWVYVDLVTGAPGAAAAEFFAVYGDAAARAPGERPAHAAQARRRRRRAPWPLRRTDIDVYGHVNNANYWAAVEEWLGGAGRRPRDRRARRSSSVAGSRPTTRASSRWPTRTAPTPRSGSSSATTRGRPRASRFAAVVTRR